MTSRTAFIGALVVLSIGLAACGDDGDEAGSTPSSDPTPPSGDTASTDGTEADPAAGEPIRIGWVNLEGGTVSIPQARFGAEAAAQFLNSELGGVGGRPIEYVRCDVDGFPESAIDCANQLVEAGVVAVQTGVAPGVDGMLPILEAAGIPMVGHAPIGDAVQTDPHAFFFASPVTLDAAGALSFFADGGAESVTYFLPDDAEMRAADEDLLSPLAEDLGIEYRTIFYDVANADWNVLSTTAMADGPDVIGGPVALEPDCIGFIAALRSAGYDGRILAGTCSVFVDVLGEQATGVITTSGLWRPDDPDAAPADKRAEIEQYVAAMDAAGHAEDVNGFAFLFFSDTVNLARVLGSIEGTIDGPAVDAALRETTDFDSFMGPVIDCAAAKAEGLTTCGDGQLVYEVTSTGEQSALTDEFIDLASLVGG